MKIYNINKIVKNEKAVTLLALIITICIMLIIVTITVDIGMESLESTRLKGFYTELEIIQRRVDVIATTNESYISNGSVFYLKEQGTSYSSMSGTQKTKLTKILADAGLGIDITKFKYFTVEQLDKILGLSNMKYDVFVNFDTRTVIAEKGIKINR